jgi:hypothetical protein
MPCGAIRTTNNVSDTVKYEARISKIPIPEWFWDYMPEISCNILGQAPSWIILVSEYLLGIHVIFCATSYANRLTSAAWEYPDCQCVPCETSCCSRAIFPNGLQQCTPCSCRVRLCKCHLLAKAIAIGLLLRLSSTRDGLFQPFCMGSLDHMCRNVYNV